MLAEADSRQRRGDRGERSADFAGGIRLGIPHVELARAAREPEQDHRLAGTARLRLFAGLQELGERETCEPGHARSGGTSGGNRHESGHLRGASASDRWCWLHGEAHAGDWSGRSSYGCLSRLAGHRAHFQCRDRIADVDGFAIHWLNRPTKSAGQRCRMNSSSHLCRGGPAVWKRCRRRPTLAAGDGLETTSGRSTVRKAQDVPYCGERCDSGSADCDIGTPGEQPEG